MDKHETTTVSDIPEVIIAEHLPTDDEPSFDSEHSPSIVNVLDGVPQVQRVYLPSTNLLPQDQLPETGLKTTHIVIHNRKHDLIDSDVLKTPQTPQTPATPATLTPSTPGSAGVDPKTGFRYTWDPAAHDVLPVRCKSIGGELYKEKFGSGGRGRCIKVGDSWYTPSEFEALGGRASSRDWKRSIRYGGRAIHCLIMEGILQPHATSCTCAACCDDESVSGPIRLFVPYKRRKGKELEYTSADKKLLLNDASRSPPSPQIKDCNNYVVSLTPTATLTTAPTFTVTNPSTNETIQVIATDAIEGTQNTYAPAEILNSLAQTTPKTSSSSVNDFMEQKQWWQLEEMVNTLINCGQQLKNLVEQTKVQSMASRELALQQLRSQMEAEKQEAIKAMQKESQLRLRRVMLEKRAGKGSILREALQKIQVDMNDDSNNDTNDDSVKHCANCNREAYAECAGCHKISYCSQFCQRKDWNSHIDDCEKDDIVLIQSVNTDSNDTS